jgi:hypothetical protein
MVSQPDVQKVLFLRDKRGLIAGYRKREQHCLWLREGVPRCGSRTRDHLSQCEGGALCPVGNLAAFLVSNGAAALTGNVEYVDGGYHNEG